MVTPRTITASNFALLSRREGAGPEHEFVFAERQLHRREGWRLRKDGTRDWAHVTITALRDDESRLLGYAS
jgi:hypothetical protein